MSGFMSEDGSSPLRYAVNNDVCLPSAQMSARHCLPWNAPACPLACRLGGVSLPRFRSGYTHALPLWQKGLSPAWFPKIPEKTKRRVSS